MTAQKKVFTVEHPVVLDSVAGFQKNRYAVDDTVIAKVNRHWQFALEAWEYPSLELAASARPERG
jgi:hypothetical protein